jgi:putative membrane protein
MDDAAMKALRAAVETIEHASAVEVVVAVRPRARRTLAAHAMAASLLLIGVLAYVLYADAEFAPIEILGLPLAAGVLGALAVEALGPLERALAPAGELVREAAQATFYQRSVHTTSGRTGLLVFLALRERQVELVGDTAVVASTRGPRSSRRSCPRAARSRRRSRGSRRTSPACSRIAMTRSTSSPTISP